MTTPLNDLDVVFQILNDLEDYAVTPISGPLSGSKSSAVPPPPVSAGLWPAPLAVHREDSGSGQSPALGRVQTGGDTAPECARLGVCLRGGATHPVCLGPPAHSKLAVGRGGVGVSCLSNKRGAGSPRCCRASHAVCWCGPPGGHGPGRFELFSACFPSVLLPPSPVSLDLHQVMVARLAVCLHVCPPARFA